MAVNHFKCTGCHHEWDSTGTPSENTCDWCGSRGYVLYRNPTNLAEIFARLVLPEVQTR